MFLAWIVPGLGHVYLGRVRRGAILFVAIGATFWVGMGFGGAMTVDRNNERWWFAAEMLAGVHGLAGWQISKHVLNDLVVDGRIDEPPPTRSMQRVTWEYALDEQLAKDDLALSYPTDIVARAFAGVAGMLNLMCVFDAVMLSLLGLTGEPKGKPKPSADKEQA